MPYRRLPNTDNARINALRTAYERGESAGTTNLPYVYGLHLESGLLLRDMENALHEYQIAFDRQVASGKEFAQRQKIARMYVSHFIQVLNLSLIREEIKPAYKELYQLPSDNNAVPDLSTESALEEWGEKIIRGEAERIKKGGTPIYNPSIAKVKAYFDIFRESRNTKNIRQTATRRAMNRLDELHPKVDALILDIWNAVEAYYADLSPETRREECRKWGLTYYFRKNEQEATPSNE